MKAGPHKSQLRRRRRLQRLWDRDGHGCFYCHCPLAHDDATFDHFIPQARGGTNDFSNLRVACVPCNTGKGHLLYEEWQRVKAERRRGRVRARPRLTWTLGEVWPQ